MASFYDPDRGILHFVDDGDNEAGGSLLDLLPEGLADAPELRELAAINSALAIHEGVELDLADYLEMTGDGDNAYFDPDAAALYDGGDN